MYHVELRQFPHNFCRFNLTERELRETILDAWARGEWIELGERKWSPHQANLTVLEGPQLPVEQLSMGRGWRNAVRKGREVTEELLATARVAASAPSGARRAAETGSCFASTLEPQAPGERVPTSDLVAGAGSALDLGLAGDSLGLEALAKLSDRPVPLAIVWKLACERYPALSVGDCLKLAEHAVRSLAKSRLVVVLAVRSGDAEPCASDEQIERLLRSIDSWSSTEGSAFAMLRRA